LGERRQTRRNSVVQLKNYTTKSKINRSWFPKENPFKGFEIGIWTNNYDLIDLHKNVVDEITLVSASGKPMTRELI
jgi:isoleucyl-tRNA synthetase